MIAKRIQNQLEVLGKWPRRFKSETILHAGYGSFLEVSILHRWYGKVWCN